MIVVLTYDHPHRKTEDVVYRLMVAGYRERLAVVGTPWVERKQRHYLYGHRPAEKHWPAEPTCSPKLIYGNLGLDYRVSRGLDNTLEAMMPEAVVVAGAGILPKSVVNAHKVMNVHPGLLPARRGLDVLKWAVLDCKPVGVTAHLCDEHTDLGWLLCDLGVPVYPEDSFHSFAMRQYEYELSLFPFALEIALAKEKEDLPKIRSAETKAYRRMPLEKEADLMTAFERYKKVYAR